MVEVLGKGRRSELNADDVIEESGTRGRVAKVLLLRRVCDVSRMIMYVTLLRTNN